MTFPVTPDKLAGMPLVSLPVIALDTETTGLDPAKARLIEIGGVRVSSGEVCGDDHFSGLVNPGMAIPETATRIHGITDGLVGDAPSFPAQMSAFIRWAGPTVVVGYSIGFDMAIMKAEHEREGLPWHMPRTLDVRHLVQLLAPNLPNPSLETAAGWLDVDIDNRHRALGDAMAAARLFVALIPKLRDRGIVNLAQAKRACLSLSGQMLVESRAGWLESGQGDAPGHTRISEYARIDSFPYRHFVSDLMHAPPLVIQAGTNLKEALATMTQRRVSSLFLAPESQGEPFGIITERDIMRAIDADGGQALLQKAARWGHRPLVTIDRGEFVYRALHRMSAHGFRHLGVVDDAGNLVGALSMRDLLRQRADDAVSLGDSIESAENPAQLGRVWGELTLVVRGLLHEEVDTRLIAALISRELRALTRRACELAEKALLAEGMGEAPVPYAMMVLGSGGRGESLLAMDQDNAIVFTEGETDGEADRWFRELGRRVADILNDVGVPYCKGGVMAANSEWRKDLAGWRKTVGAWIGRSKPEDLLNCDIFFDAVPVHGDAALAETLLTEARKAAQGSRSFLRLLALNASSFSLPTGLFGRFKLTDGRMDIKIGGVLPICSAARVAALEHAIAVRATPDRLQALLPLGITSDKVIGNLVSAHGILLTLILRQQVLDIDSGAALSTRIVPGNLTGFEKQQLKWALEQVASVANILGTPAV